jgi:signal peptidase I
MEREVDRAPLDGAAPAADPPPKGNSILRDVIETIVLVVIVVFVARSLFENYVIEQRSAIPNFYPGQRVFVDKLVFRLGGLKRGDIIVVHPKSGGADLFKRVIGLPGELLDIHDNQVFVNGEALRESYVAPDANSEFGLSVPMPIKLGASEYFLMGDNRSESADSRRFGPFESTKIVGRVFLRYWPIDSFTLVQGADYTAPAR